MFIQLAIRLVSCMIRIFMILQEQLILVKVCIVWRQVNCCLGLTSEVRLLVANCLHWRSCCGIRVWCFEVVCVVLLDISNALATLA